jgi:hypothetical protein
VFLPYLSSFYQLFVNLFLPSSAIPDLLINPVVNPIGFGLTYWSIGQLARFTSFSIDSSFFSFIMILSVVLVVVGLLGVYWKTSKMTFGKTDNLIIALLTSVFVFFVLFRYVCEQWFIWAIPFFVILVVAGRLKPIYYWLASLIAFLYIFVNLPLPFFLLPLAPQMGTALVTFAQWSLSFEPLRITLLALLGCAFSGLIIVLLAKMFSSKIVDA